MMASPQAQVRNSILSKVNETDYKIKIVYLGTSSARPVDGQAMSCMCILRNDEILMFDVGEGTQHSFAKAKLDWNKKMKIFVTHLHGDHIFGILGLIQTMSLEKRTNNLEIYGPEGIDDFILQSMSILKFEPTFSLSVQEINEGIIFDNGSYSIRACTAQHRVSAFSYLFEEKLEQLGIMNKRIGISGDTRPTTKLEKFFEKCDYLTFESTFLEKEKARAIKDCHSTAKEAATLAKNADVANLIITHFSKDEERKQLLKEARKIHPSVVAAKDLLKINVFRFSSKKSKINYNFPSLFSMNILDNIFSCTRQKLIYFLRCSS